MSDIAGYTHEILERLGVEDPFDHAGALVSRSPIDGSEIGRLRAHTSDEVASVVGQAQQAFEAWRTVPAPVRGELVRELGQLLRRAQGGPGRPGVDRGREDRLRGAR